MAMTGGRWSERRGSRVLPRERVAEAERDYHDCLARFGHNSAEAHAARTIWKQLRRAGARSQRTGC